MAVELEHPPLAPPIQSLLAALRSRIRSYVWAAGLAGAIVTLGLAFWSTLAFDWLFEPPWQFRALMLAASGIALLYTVYRFIVLRAFRPLADTSMAMLLERRFPDYRDSLLTTVELGAQRSHAASFSREMLSHTAHQALLQSRGRRLAPVFRLAPLLRSLALAAACAASVLAFGVLVPEALGVWAQRIVLLKPDLLWPRDNHVRVQGFSDDRRVKVAKGSDLQVVAVADLTGRYRLPETVQVRYRTDEGTRGRDNMSTVGLARAGDREQKFSYVFKGIMSPITFDVLGGDDRDRGLRIEVVDSPTISRMDLACQYPAYTGRPPATLPASGLVQLPMGTKVAIHCEANKDLLQALITIVRGQSADTLAHIKLPARGDRRHFSVEVPPLMEDVTLLFDLHDADGIHSRDPVRLLLTARPDDVPAVALRLRGISGAITTQARLPVVGEVRDDYGLARLWYEYQLDAAAPKGKSSTAPLPETAKDPTAAQPFHTSTLGPDGRPRSELNIEPTDDEAFDLKRLDEQAKLLPEVGQRLLLSLKAADNCALAAGENVGQGERYQLEIVAPEQLLSMLEGRELVLRRRFEAIYQEMTETRDLLTRIDFASPDASAPSADKPAAEPGDEPAEDAARQQVEANETPQARAARLAKRALELRDLRSNRALDNSQRALHEAATVADSFDEIREEMVNNRIDTPELQHRLKDQIADPLRRICLGMFPPFVRSLEELRRRLEDPAAGPQKRDQALAQADAILVEMKLVLDKMLELETFNEIIDTLRQIIANQDKLNQQTLEQQKEELKKKLRDLED